MSLRVDTGFQLEFSFDGASAPAADGVTVWRQERRARLLELSAALGLPQPREVIVTPVSAHLGTPPAHAFPRLRRKDGSERRHTHAILIFDEPVCGPILLCAGRYRGYGLCRPMEGDA